MCNKIVFKSPCDMRVFLAAETPPQDGNHEISYLSKIHLHSVEQVTEKEARWAILILIAQSFQYLRHHENSESKAVEKLKNTVQKSGISLFSKYFAGRPLTVREFSQWHYTLCGKPTLVHSPDIENFKRYLRNNPTTIRT